MAERSEKATADNTSDSAPLGANLAEGSAVSSSLGSGDGSHDAQTFSGDERRSSDGSLKRGGGRGVVVGEDIEAVEAAEAAEVAEVAEGAAEEGAGDVVAAIVEVAEPARAIKIAHLKGVVEMVVDADGAESRPVVNGSRKWIPAQFRAVTSWRDTAVLAISATFSTRLAAMVPRAMMKALITPSPPW